MIKNHRDTEYKISFDNQTAVVSPFGASLRRYFVTTAGSEWNAVWGYAGTENKCGGQGDVLIPFAGRIRGGVYDFDGCTHQLAKNDKDGPNAIHGFVRSQLFETTKISETKAVFTYDIDAVNRPIAGYPFSLKIEVSYLIDASGLTTNFQITNTGSADAPAGAGFHPYFRGDQGELADWEVIIPADSYVELENLLPTGRMLSVEQTEFDFRSGRAIGNSSYNGCLAHLKRDARGWSTATVSAKNSSRQVSIRMDPGFEYVVIYTGDAIAPPNARPGFAIEPMTCAPDAFNYPALGLRQLAPGESMSGSFVIKAE